MESKRRVSILIQFCAAHRCRIVSCRLQYCLLATFRLRRSISDFVDMLSSRSNLAFTSPFTFILSTGTPLGSRSNLLAEIRVTPTGNGAVFTATRTAVPAPQPTSHLTNYDTYAFRVLRTEYNAYVRLLPRVVQTAFRLVAHHLVLDLLQTEQMDL